VFIKLSHNFSPQNAKYKIEFIYKGDMKVQKVAYSLGVSNSEQKSIKDYLLELKSRNMSHACIHDYKQNNSNLRHSWKYTIIMPCNAICLRYDLWSIWAISNAFQVECISSQDFTYNLKPIFAYSIESP
jgi:hypothetical protein